MSRGGLAQAVTGFGLDADQHRRIAGLGGLQRGGELERMARHHPVVVVGGGDQGGRVTAPGLRLCSGE